MKLKKGGRLSALAGKIKKKTNRRQQRYRSITDDADASFNSNSVTLHGNDSHNQNVDGDEETISKEDRDNQDSLVAEEGEEGKATYNKLQVSERESSLAPTADQHHHHLKATKVEADHEIKQDEFSSASKVVTGTRNLEYGLSEVQDQIPTSAESNAGNNHETIGAGIGEQVRDAIDKCDHALDTIDGPYRPVRLTSTAESAKSMDDRMMKLLERHEKLLSSLDSYSSDEEDKEDVASSSSLLQVPKIDTVNSTMKKENEDDIVSLETCDKDSKHFDKKKAMREDTERDCVEHNRPEEEWTGRAGMGSEVKEQRGEDEIASSIGLEMSPSGFNDLKETSFMRDSPPEQNKMISSDTKPTAAVRSSPSTSSKEASRPIALEEPYAEFASFEQALSAASSIEHMLSQALEESSVSTAGSRPNGKDSNATKRSSKRASSTRKADKIKTSSRAHSKGSPKTLSSSKVQETVESGLPVAVPKQQKGDKSNYHTPSLEPDAIEESRERSLSKENLRVGPEQIESPKVIVHESRASAVAGLKPVNKFDAATADSIENMKVPAYNFNEAIEEEDVVSQSPSIMHRFAKAKIAKWVKKNKRMTQQRNARQANEAAVESKNGPENCPVSAQVTAPEASISSDAKSPALKEQDKEIIKQEIEEQETKRHDDLSRRVSELELLASPDSKKASTSEKYFAIKQSKPTSSCRSSVSRSSGLSIDDELETPPYSTSKMSSTTRSLAGPDARPVRVAYETRQESICDDNHRPETVSLSHSADRSMARNASPGPSVSVRSNDSSVRSNRMADMIWWSEKREGVEIIAVENEIFSAATAGGSVVSAASIYSTMAASMSSGRKTKESKKKSHDDQISKRSSSKRKGGSRMQGADVRRRRGKRYERKQRYEPSLVASASEMSDFVEQCACKEVIHEDAPFLCNAGIRGDEGEDRSEDQSENSLEFEEVARDLRDMAKELARKGPSVVVEWLS